MVVGAKLPSPPRLDPVVVGLTVAPGLEEVNLNEVVVIVGGEAVVVGRPLTVVVKGARDP